MTNFSLCPLGYKHLETKTENNNFIGKWADQRTTYTHTYYKIFMHLCSGYLQKILIYIEFNMHQEFKLLFLVKVFTSPLIKHKNFQPVETCQLIE